MDWITNWKEKKTGEIVTLSSIGGTSVTIRGGDGKSVSIDEKKFKEQFEPITLDFQAIKDQIAELCNLSPEFERLGKIVMKRLDPTYFEQGKLVYISCLNLLKRDSIYYYGGTEHPYKILYIRPSRKSRYDFEDYALEIGIRLAVKKTGDADYEFPIYLTRPDSEDAYWFLSRYDKPY